MAGRTVPESDTRPDWARLVAQEVNAHRNRLNTLSLASLGNFANDAAAATGGVVVGGYYRNGSVLMIRVA